MRVRVRLQSPEMVMLGELLERQLDRGRPSPKWLAVSCCAHLAIGWGLWAASGYVVPQVRAETRDPRHAIQIRLGDRLYAVSRIAAPGRDESAERGKPDRTNSLPKDMKRDPAAEETLIQPDSPSDVAPDDLNLPSFRFWAALMPNVPKLFVAPGARVTEQELLPVLAPPTFDLSRIEAPPDPTALLKLPQVPAPLDPPPAETAATPRLPVGDPVNIVSVSDRPPTPADAIRIPAGNVAAGGDGNGAKGAAGVENDSRVPKKSETIIVQPANGKFDAVVIQSSPLDLFPEARGLLTGRPVYTVYLAVGTNKEWALYYCVPQAEQKDASETKVIELTPVAPVGAPYPTRMVRPQIKLPSYEKYLLVHGYVTEDGRCRDVRVVGGEAEADEAIVASLGEWQFRPADRDGVPIAVEFLLAIPAAGL